MHGRNLMKLVPKLQELLHSQTLRGKKCEADKMAVLLQRVSKI